MRIALALAMLFTFSAVGCGNSSDQASIPPTAKLEPAWYEGGTLTKGTIGEWRSATYKNRLASSADFAAVVVNNSGERLRSMDELLPKARNMEACISEAGAGGKTDSMQVSGVAAACAMLMGAGG